MFIVKDDIYKYKTYIWFIKKAKIDRKKKIATKKREWSNNIFNSKYISSK